MPLSKSEKEQIVTEAVQMLRGAHMVIFADYKGLSVAKSMQFRRKVKKSGGSFKVLKKTLAKLALAKAGLPADTLEKYKENLAVAVHATEDSAFAKIFAQAAKDFPELKVTGGIYDGKTISLVEVNALAKLPSREELLAKLLGTISAPVNGFVRVINGPLAGFATIINKLATANKA
jgi:large subunit ribosomal protein L10